ncbi:MAG: hypothetical protein RLZZ628_2824 [Bacteroidota bacterium]|jgi:hypothetical protein
MGCVKENDIPAYIYIEPIQMTVTAGQGTALHKMMDAHVFIDNENRGAYQLPAKIPILGTGQHTLTILPGIRNNGIKANPIPYAFAQTYEKILNLSAAKVDTIRPTTRYTNDTYFKMIENFESANHLFNNHRDQNVTFLMTTEAGGLEGKAGKMVLNPMNKLMVKSTTSRYTFPTDAQNIYIELNYKTDVALSIGFTAFNAANGTVGEDNFPVVLYPKHDWNKTYINITNEIKASKGIEFQVTVGALLPDSLTTGTVWLDNIKLLQR